MRNPANLPLAKINRYPVLVGLFTLMLFVGALVTWSSTAKLSSAVVVNGVLQTDAPKYTIQHLNGGTIAEIAVRNNDQVRKGQILVRFDVSADRAQLRGLRFSQIAALAELARARASLEDGQVLVFSKNLEKLVENHDHRKILLFESRRFHLHRRQTSDEKMRLAGEVSALDVIIPDLKKRLKMRQVEKRLVRERVVAMKFLRSAGHASINELRNLKTQLADRDAELLDTRVRLNSTIKALQQARLQSAAYVPKIKSELAERIAKLQIGATDLATRIENLQLNIGRAKVRAPVAGKIVDMQVATGGQVVAAGGVLMQIVAESPTNSVLVKVKPTDIDRIWVGQTAKIVLSAFPQRNLPQIDATVTSVSADAISDRASGASLFEAQIKLSDASMQDAKLVFGGEINLMPGMPAQAFIINGSNTLLGYLFEPYQLAFQKAFSGN